MSTATPHEIRGRIEKIRDNRLLGWLWDSRRPAASLTAEIYVDGEAVATLLASRRRGDLQRAGIGDGAHGFALRLPVAISSRDNITVQLRTQVDGTSVLIDERRLITAEQSVIVGRLEEPRRGKLIGWAFDPAHPSHHLKVGFRLPNGRMVSTIANRQRVDLQRAGIGDGAHGFELPFASLPLDGTEEVEIVAFVRDRGTERTIGRRHLPISTELLCHLGNAALELGRYDEAASRFAAAAELDPSAAQPHSSFADLHEGRGEIVDAIAALTRALELTSKRDTPPLRRRLQSLRRRQLSQNGLAFLAWPATHPLPNLAGPRIAVVSWDLAHNPLGRAWVLAELAARHGPTEVLGPVFSSFGSTLWGPLRDSDRSLPIFGYHVGSFVDFINGAIRLVLDHPCDVVWVSKPRLPSLLIGLLQRLIHGARLVVDIDDDELAFVHADAPLSLNEFLDGDCTKDWSDPYGMRWTQLAQSMIPWADAVTTCNPVLQARHGGILVRHARDEAAYDPTRIDRHAVRATFGFADDDKVVLFLGTPRRHKGLIEVARVLQALSDPRVVLCVVGTIADSALCQELSEFTGLRVSLHPDQPFRRAAELNAMADLVCILQDPDSPIARSQTPAKLSDALAAGVPVLARATPPLDDLLPEAVKSEEDLVEGLHRALNGKHDPAATRALFLRELSYAANAPRAARALSAARNATTGVPPGFLRLLAHIDRQMPGLIDPALAPHLGGAIPSFPRVGRLNRLSGGVNIAFFWKQNDSGLYGRRQDMLLRQLERQPWVRRILHIDAPISADRLEVMSAPQAGSQHRFSAAATLQRFLCTQDQGKVHRRVHLHAGRCQTVLGHKLPPRELFPQAVEEWLSELDMTENLLAWVCPVVPLFPQIQARLGFSFILSDVIDDQRQWSMRPAFRRELEANYGATFASSDMLVANCRPVADWLISEGFDPLLVPNGMELHDGVEDWPVPASLAGFRRPIIGYAGNLQDRIDWDMIGAVADARPDWSVVLIGATPVSDPATEVMARPNVHALGVVPHAQANSHIAAFDVAIIPHLHTKLSEGMNPLKLYVYRSLGLPVVSTPVPNLDDLVSEIRVADTPQAFIAALEQALAERRDGRKWPEAAQMRALSWKARMETILACLGQVFEERAAMITPDQTAMATT